MTQWDGGFQHDTDPAMLPTQADGDASDRSAAAARPYLVVPRQVSAQQHDSEGQPARAAGAGARADLVDAAEGDALEPLQNWCARLSGGMLRHGCLRACTNANATLQTADGF